MLDVRGAIAVVPEVLFATPRELDRSAPNTEGHLRSLADKIDLPLATEATAQERGIYAAAVAGQSRDLRKRGAGTMLMSGALMMRRQF